ncbi:MAG TPA: SPFH domain-containing protein [Steroidobacteraceae bacterium]
MAPERTGPSALAQSAWLQAAGLAFMALYGVAIVAALVWLTSNVREIPPQKRAVVIRLGALSEIKDAGLLIAFPRPIDEVVLLPSAETIIEQDLKVENPPASAPQLTQDPESGDDASTTTLSDADASVGSRLTGDAGVVQMDAKIYYRVIDPYEYVVQKNHLAPALDRLIGRSIVWVCASRDVDAILVARPELVGVNTQVAAERERLRLEVMQDINQRLARLHAAGAGLGIELRRVDLISRLHPDTVDAFNAVLTASQQALQAIADARTDAERTLQSANEEADRTIETAEAKASERTAQAQAHTADVVQLAQALKTGVDAGMLLRIYRQRITAVLSKTPSLILVNPGDDTHLIVQGAINAPAGQ